MHKLWWQSKTLWVNLITLAILVLSDLQHFAMTNEELAFIAKAIVVLNVVLRIVTSKAIQWGESNDEPME